MKKAMILFLLGVWLVGCAPAATAPTGNTAFSRITHVYAFGDDMSDNGNFYKLMKDAVTKGKQDAAILDWLTNFMWQGRLSNGPVLAEVLADQLKVDLTSYAVIGATTGNRSSDSANYGLLWQVNQFKSEGKKIDPGALFLINGGGYDIATYAVDDKGDLSDQAINAQADKVVSNIVSAISSLSVLGAKQFIVGSEVDVLKYPGMVGSEFASPYKVFQDRLNSQLPVTLAKVAPLLNVKIQTFDFIAAEEQIRKNAGQNGLTNLTDACAVAAPEKKVCANPDEYYYWTNFQLTRRVHQLLAQAMADTVIE